MAEKPKSTKQRLLETACSIFAEKGYHNTTVADICETADANIAAVNYHFGDKATLYKEVWKHLHAIVDQAVPVPESHEEVGAEIWLRLFMRSRLKTIFSQGELTLLPKIIFREMSERTELNDELFRTHLQPNRNKVTNAIRDLLGNGFSEKQVELATINYMGVHIFMNVGHQKRKHFPSQHHRMPVSFDEPLMQQIEDFAIGGLKAIKGKSA
ncbi:MAG: CerR family C-terminal domain-containing protein [Kiritimatiellales bacterium]|nr:CerR family C-terminal domain-containing protein [Kiritimatiellales bacterium]